MSTGGENVFLGSSSGNGTSTGVRNTIIGSCSSNRQNASGNTCIGSSAGCALNSSFNTCIGINAGSIGTTGNENVYVGNGAGSGGAGTSQSIFLGSNTLAGLNSQGATAPLLSVICIGTRSYVAGNYAVAIGGSANTGAQGGVNGVAIGNGAFGGNGGIGIGLGAAGGWGWETKSSIAIGSNAKAYNDFGISIGNNTNSAANAVAIGNGALANGPGSVSIGLNANAGSNQTNGVAIGANATVTGGWSTNSVAIGFNAQANCNNNSIVIGSPNSPSNFGNNVRVGIANLDEYGNGPAGPTTRFHVDCRNNLPTNFPNNSPVPAITNIPSAIRFQGLQTATTCTGMSELVIDGNGYIMKKLSSCPAARTANTDSLSTKTDSLLKLIQDLQTKLSTLEKDMDKCCTKGISSSTSIPFNTEIKLYQNVPNPFNQTTEIKFFIPEIVRKASLVIYDLQGKELRKMEINDRNEASVKIYAKEFAAGMYIYTLIADDSEVDSKRMILTGN